VFVPRMLNEVLEEARLSGASREDMDMLSDKWTAAANLRRWVLLCANELV
jgi:hypothetical protein